MHVIIICTMSSATYARGKINVVSQTLLPLYVAYNEKKRFFTFFYKNAF